MKITIYELLGLVKDGKAPKKIKFRNEICEYESHGFIDYVGIDKETNIKFYLSSYIGNNYISDIFTDEVEIIEEQEDKEDKIQKIYHCETGLIQNEVEIFIIKQLNQMVDKINELIDEINNLKEND